MFDESEEERIGVYVCHCGTNIAGVVDVDSVTRFAADDLERRGVVLSRHYTFMCSTTGQDLIQKDIQEHGLTRVVVAACSPHLHEGTFRTACERAGLNPYLCELASIREHVAWVHTDHVAATAKAKARVIGMCRRTGAPAMEAKGRRRATAGGALGAGNGPAGNAAVVRRVGEENVGR